MSYLLPRSVYVSFRGTIIEYDIRNDPNFRNNINRVSSVHDWMCRVDWVVDYTGQLYKDRFDDREEIIRFLRSDRKCKLVCKTKAELTEMLDLVNDVTHAHTQHMTKYEV